MKRFAKIMSVLMVAIMLVCCFATVASAKNNTAEYQKSVVHIECTQMFTAANDDSVVVLASATGTGFAVDVPGEKVQYIATAAHVVYDPSGVYSLYFLGDTLVECELQADGTKYPKMEPQIVNGVEYQVYTDYFTVAQVEMRAIYSNSTGDYVDLTLAQVNNDVDLAICKLASAPTDKITALPLQFKEDVEIGDDIIAIGYSGVSEVFNEELRLDSTDSTIKDGKISKKVTTKGNRGSKTTFDAYEITAAVTHGMSGGPVVDEETGAIVGVVSFGTIEADADAAYMAVCIDNLKPLLEAEGISYESTSDSNLLLFIIIGVGALILILIIVIIIILTKKNNNPPMNNVPVIPMAPPAGPVGGAPVSSAHLLGISGPFAGRKFGIQERAIIGRDKAKCNVVFPIDQPGVSGLHCEVKVSGGVITLKDFGSSYGTFLSNGTKIAPNSPVVLQNGARFWVGTSENVFEVRI